MYKFKLDDQYFMNSLNRNEKSLSHKKYCIHTNVTHGVAKAGFAKELARKMFLQP